MTQKRQPERMCVGCGTRRPKAELIRVVCNKEGAVFLDPTGKADGRGAYLCPAAACLQKAKKSGRLQRAFGRAVSEEIYAGLERELSV